MLNPKTNLMDPPEFPCVRMKGCLCEINYTNSPDTQWGCGYPVDCPFIAFPAKQAEVELQ